MKINKSIFFQIILSSFAFIASVGADQVSLSKGWQVVTVSKNDIFLAPSGKFEQNASSQLVAWTKKKTKKGRIPTVLLRKVEQALQGAEIKDELVDIEQYEALMIDLQGNISWGPLAGRASRKKMRLFLEKKGDEFLIRARRKSKKTKQNNIYYLALDENNNLITTKNKKDATSFSIKMIRKLAKRKIAIPASSKDIKENSLTAAVV